jgi:hypothetical protein
MSGYGSGVKVRVLVEVEVGVRVRVGLGVRVLVRVGVKVEVLEPPQVTKLSAGLFIQPNTDTPEVVNWLAMKLFPLQVPLFHPAVLSDLSQYDQLHQLMLLFRK